MKTQLIHIAIERPHCCEIVLRNLQRCEKPENLEALLIINATEGYFQYYSQRFLDIFPNAKIVRTDIDAVTHEMIENDFEKYEQIKTDNVFKTYQIAINNCSKDADYIWIIEDDNIFPLNTFDRYLEHIDKENVCAVAGISWHWFYDKTLHNFWRLNVVPRENPETEQFADLEVKLYERKFSGFDYIEATGCPNVLMKADLFRNAPLLHLQKIWGSGADHCLYTYFRNLGFYLIGIWDLSLPHFTRRPNGDVILFGNLDKTLLELL